MFFDWKTSSGWLLKYHFKDDKQKLCKIRIQADLSSIHPNANYKEKGIFSFVCKIAGCSSLSDDIN